MTRTTRRKLLAGAVAAAGLPMALGVGAAGADGKGVKGLGFTPITTAALPCSASGLIAWANDADGKPVTSTLLMKAGDPATLLGTATPAKVGRVNDMIALSPDGKYLYTVSENGDPAEDGGVPNSDGVTRLTLKGKRAGKKEILARNVDAAGKNVWSRVDGVKWYPHGGADDRGMLLISEEFDKGGVWQVDPDTGAFARLDWIGNYAHEGIGLASDGTMYLGDESRTGAIYKAVPKDPSDLTKGGTLFFLVGTGTDPSGWKKVADPANAAAEASAGKGVLFDRPEDFDERHGRIYFAVTEPDADAKTRTGAAGQIVNAGGVYSFAASGVPELATASGTAPYKALTPMIAVNDPKYADAAAAKAQQGLQFPDNLAFDRAGNLWVHEDIPDGATFPANGTDVSKQVRDQQDELYVFVLDKAGKTVVPNPDATGPGVSGGYKVADMRTSPAAKPCENEFSGGIFDRDGEQLYINQQHIDSSTQTVSFED